MGVFLSLFAPFLGVFFLIQCERVSKLATFIKECNLENKLRRTYKHFHTIIKTKLLLCSMVDLMLEIDTCILDSCWKILLLLVFPM